MRTTYKGLLILIIMNLVIAHRQSAMSQTRQYNFNPSLNPSSPSHSFTAPMLSHAFLHACSSLMNSDMEFSKTKLPKLAPKSIYIKFDITQKYDNVQKWKSNVISLISIWDSTFFHIDTRFTSKTIFCWRIASVSVSFSLS